MERKTAHDFDQELLILFDAYVHGALDRRGFLDKASKYAVGGVTAAMLLDQLSPRFAEAQVVKPEDERIKAQSVEYDSPNGTGKMRGYLVQPAKAAGKLPAILVVHENRGLNPHIEDVARRLALDNFVAFAPDALFPLGGYPGDEDKARELFSKLDQTKTREDFVTAASWLKARPETNGRVGAVGFCYGGGIVNMLATRVPELAWPASRSTAARPPSRTCRRSRRALMIQSAETDERINAGWPAYEAALKAAERQVRALPVPRHAARVQQRHDAALRRRGREARLGAHARVLQQAPAAGRVAAAGCVSRAASVSDTQQPPRSAPGRKAPSLGLTLEIVVHRVHRTVALDGHISVRREIVEESVSRVGLYLDADQLGPIALDIKPFQRFGLGAFDVHRHEVHLLNPLGAE